MRIYRIKANNLIKQVYADISNDDGFRFYRVRTVSNPIESLEHITLNTGRSRISYRSEVEDKVIDIMISMIDKLQDEDMIQIPDIEEVFTFSIRNQANTLVATVWFPKKSGDPRPISSFGVADGCTEPGIKLWKNLHEMAVPNPIKMTRACPDGPWCAARLDIGTNMCPAAMEWMGNFERCLAWAWIEKSRQ